MPSVGAVTSNLNIVSKTSAYTAIANDFVLASAASGAVTITLPASPALNTVVAVKKTDATTSAVSVVPSGTAKIDGDTSVLLAVAYASITLQFDGTDWRMLSTAEVNTANAAAGLPSGGTAGQALLKTTATNYDASWGTVSGLPTGGTTGQVLRKTSATNYDATWAALSAGGAGHFYPWGGSRWMLPPMRVNEIAGVQAPSNITYFYPMMIPNACTVVRGAAFYSASFTTSLWLGLFTERSGATSLGPDVLLVQSKSALIASTVNTVELGYTFTAPTPVWVAWTISASATFYHHSTPGMMRNMLITGDLNTDLSSSITSRYSSAYTYNSPLTGNAGSLTLTNTTQQMPVIAFYTT